MSTPNDTTGDLQTQLFSAAEATENVARELERLAGIEERLKARLKQIEDTVDNAKDVAALSIVGYRSDVKHWLDNLSAERKAEHETISKYLGVDSKFSE